MARATFVKKAQKDKEKVAKFGAFDLMSLSIVPEDGVKLLDFDSNTTRIKELVYKVLTTKQK